MPAECPRIHCSRSRLVEGRRTTSQNSRVACFRAILRPSRSSCYYILGTLWHLRITVTCIQKKNRLPHNEKIKKKSTVRRFGRKNKTNLNTIPHFNPKSVCRCSNKIYCIQQSAKRQRRYPYSAYTLFIYNRTEP